MAARKRRRGRRSLSLSDESPAVQAVFGLHFHASRRLEEILAEVRVLRSNGRTTGLKALLKQAAGIRKSLRALEEEARDTPRAPQEPRAPSPRRIAK